MKMHCRARESNFCLGETTVKVVDYIVAQKVIYFFSKGDGKRLMIYVAG